MFQHSVKVPRHYKVAANIFKKTCTEGGSVKSLLYDDKLKHFRTNVLYALITETIKHAAEIDKIFESCQILTKEPRLDPWLAKVLAVELLYGKKALPGNSKPEITILSYKEQFEQIKPKPRDELNKKVRRPRYVRVNTNLLATSDAIRAFQDEGYKFIRCTSGSYDDYLQQIQSLTEYDFTQDYHIKTMFVFAPGTKLHEHDLYLEDQIILQDKATALAVHLLAPPQGSVALDMCAAPGMKTTQLAAYLRNQGKIYAVERNEDRYNTLCDFVQRTGSKCVETLHKDSLEIKRGDYDDVEYILLDPSCSGSGMELQVHNYIDDTRLARLTSLQEKFLKHAMNSFPNAKRIVYSTCSLFPEENERVITNIVKASRAKWRVQDVKELLKGQWNNFGSGMYGSIGTRCLYAVPDSDLTTGFFLAVLERDPKDWEKSKNKDVNIEEMSNDAEAEEKRDRKKRKEQQDSSSERNDQTSIQLNDFEDGSQKRKKKKKSKNIADLDDIDVKTETDSEVPEKKKKRKRSEKRDDDSKDIDKPDDEANCNIDLESPIDVTDSVERKRKKKKSKLEKEMLKDLNTDDDNINDICNNESIIEVNTEEPPKKKKKKDKKRDLEENIESINTNTETIEDSNKKSKKKKKNDKQI